MLNIVFLTDLHIGVARISPHRVYHNLNRYFYPSLRDCQLLVIGGDLYDALLNLDGTPGLYAHMIIQDLRHYAKQYKFFIRVIRGTFTHDRNQLQHLLVEADKQTPLKHDNVPAVVLYDDIAVEQLKPLGLTLLYIPDDLPYTDALAVAKERLSAAQLSKVDVVVHHGYCTHLLPFNMPHIPPNTYTLKEYQQLYHGVMLNGHVHFMNVMENCISGGSFERFCHGEEEPKGYFVIRYDPSTHHSQFQFIENQGAAIFKTFKLSTKTDEFELFKEQVTAYMQKLDPSQDVNLRVEIDEPAYRGWVQTWVGTTYPNVVLTVKLARDSDHAPVDSVTLEHSDLPVLTPANIVSHVLQFLKKHTITLTESDIAEVYEPLIPNNTLTPEINHGAEPQAGDGSA